MKNLAPNIRNPRAESTAGRHYIDSSSRSLRQKLVKSGDSLTLRDWLELSWFYPSGFGKEQVLETPNSYVSLGRDLAYKFPKTKIAEGDVFLEEKSELAWEDKWETLCNEALDHQRLAPGFIAGVQPISWIDEEPYWLPTVPVSSLAPRKPPVRANEAALVMHRYRAKDLLSARLDSLEASDGRIFSKVSRSLSSFHKASRKGHQALDEHRYFLEDSCLDALDRFFLSSGDSLDPYSRLSFLEGRAFLSSEIQRNFDLLYNRAKDGYVVASHGELSSDVVCFKNFYLSEPRRVHFVGRPSRGHPLRVADVCSDVSSLVVDLEARGYLESAKLFKKGYRKSFSKSLDERIFRFYTVLNALAKAGRAFLRGEEASTPTHSALLQVAFRHTFQLSSSSVVAVGGEDESKRNKIAKGISELTGFEILQVAPEHFPGQLGFVEESQWSLSDNAVILSRMLHLLKMKLRRGIPVIFSFPFSRLEERLELLTLAKEEHINVCLSHIGGGGLWSEPHELPMIQSDFTLSLPELSLEILRGLKRTTPVKA